MNGWRTVGKSASASFVERKSEFIGNIAPASSEEEALAFISKIKKQYADAKHNVYAYIIRENNIVRFSDDGEPHGTAGMPVLDVLRKEDLTNVVVVVTRYFGGILLGTGGLVRAYTQGAKMALDNAGTACVEKLVVFNIHCNYSEHQKIESLLSHWNLLLMNTDFSDRVRLELASREEDYPDILAKITEQTNGRVRMEIVGEQYAVL